MDWIQSWIDHVCGCIDPPFLGNTPSKQRRLRLPPDTDAAFASDHAGEVHAAVELLVVNGIHPQHDTCSALRAAKVTWPFWHLPILGLIHPGGGMCHSCCCSWYWDEGLWSSCIVRAIAATTSSSSSLPRTRNVCVPFTLLAATFVTVAPTVTALDSSADLRWLCFSRNSWGSSRNAATFLYLSITTQMSMKSQGNLALASRRLYSCLA